MRFQPKDRRFAFACLSVVGLLSGCVPSEVGPPPTTGSGGASGIPGAGGSTTVPPAPGSGGSNGMPDNTGGATSPPVGSGGADAPLGGGGTDSGGRGGNDGRGGNGGLIGTATGGAGGTSSSGGGSGGGGGAGSGAGGRGGGAGSVVVGSGGSPGPITPPVRDTASKIPLSSAPGYTVEGNYAYGPLPVQRLDVIYPPGAGPRGTQVLPAVLMFHGGAWIHGYKEANGKDHMSTFFNRFLAHGFMVCNAEYRVNNNTTEGAPAPAAVQDALLAAKWCWDHLDYFHGDKTKFVVTGASAGGHLALMVGMTTAAANLGPTNPTSFKIAGIVDGYGPADIEMELGGVASGWIPSSLPNRAAVAKLVNPITYVRADIPPLIVVQGSEDGVAPVAHSIRLVNLLKAAGADATMAQVPGAGHGYTTIANGWTVAEKAMFDWLKARGMGK